MPVHTTPYFRVAATTATTTTTMTTTLDKHVASVTATLDRTLNAFHDMHIQRETLWMHLGHLLRAYTQSGVHAPPPANALSVAIPPAGLERVCAELSAISAWARTVLKEHMASFLRDVGARRRVEDRWGIITCATVLHILLTAIMHMPSTDTCGACTCSGHRRCALYLEFASVLAQNLTRDILNRTITWDALVTDVVTGVMQDPAPRYMESAVFALHLAAWMGPLCQIRSCPFAAAVKTRAKAQGLSFRRPALTHFNITDALYNAVVTLPAAERTTVDISARVNDIHECLKPLLDNPYVAYKPVMASDIHSLFRRYPMITNRTQ